MTVNKNIEDNFNYFNVSDEVRNQIDSCVKKNGYNLLNVMKSSNHKDDHFLYIVLANKKDALNGYEYVCWKYNGRGLNNGGYHSTFKAAMFDMVHRIHDMEHNKLADKWMDNLEETDINTMNNLLRNEYQIIRYTDDLPTVMTLSKDEINEFKYLNKAVAGYDELAYHKDDFTKNEQEKIEFMMSEKSICAAIQSDIEDYIADEVDLTSIKSNIVQKYVKEYEIQHNPLESVIENATELSNKKNNQDNEEKTNEPEI